MRLPSVIVGLLASLVLFGCSGPKSEAKAPETNPWADYKGTYAGAAEPASAAETKSASATETKPAGAAEPKPAGAAEPKPKTTTKKPGKAGAKKAPRAKS